MRAAIDIGSNSVRLAFSDGSVRSEITKLADGTGKTGRLSSQGVERTLEVLKTFAAACGDTPVVAFATEAVRAASDGAEFCAAVKRETGLTVKVLSSEAEAKLALLGAYKKAGACTVCDLGGGSMELISASDGVTPEYIKSLPLGVVMLKNKYNGDYKSAVRDAPTLVADYGATAPYPLTVSGGSVCAIAAAIQNLRVYDKRRINGAYITARELDSILPMLQRPDLPVLRPVCSKRADTVAYGGIILRALINHMGLTGFYVSDSGNLDAVLDGALDDM